MQTVKSGDTESDPSLNNLPTFTFRNAAYASQHLTFAPVEERDRHGKALQQPTADQRALLVKYDKPPYTNTAGAIPFVSFNDQYVSIGATYDVRLLHGKTQTRVAAALADPASALGKAIDGTANVFTAALCRITGNQPASVCSTAGVQAAAGKMGG